MYHIHIYLFIVLYLEELLQPTNLKLDMIHFVS